MRVLSLDHVALWVADRNALARFLIESLGMHEIERTDAFTLVGADARRGKLTLFAAEGPREPGLLARVGLRVGDVDAVLARLPEDMAVARIGEELASVRAPEGLHLQLVATSEGTSAEPDLDHVAFRVPDPDVTFDRFVSLGFGAAGDRLTADSAYLRFEPGEPEATERPLLNHLGLRVASCAEHRREAEDRGLEIDKVVDAENTVAVFVRGPHGIVLEYVEHKAGFALV